MAHIHKPARLTTTNPHPKGRTPAHRSSCSLASGVRSMIRSMIRCGLNEAMPITSKWSVSGHGRSVVTAQQVVVSGAAPLLPVRLPHSPRETFPSNCMGRGARLTTGAGRLPLPRCQGEGALVAPGVRLPHPCGPGGARSTTQTGVQPTVEQHSSVVTSSPAVSPADASSCKVMDD